MGLLDRLKGEMKNAGIAVRDTLDEGKTRIEIFRVRQSADAAAQALGYAVHRAKRDGKLRNTHLRERREVRWWRWIAKR